MLLADFIIPILGVFTIPYLYGGFVIDFKWINLGIRHPKHANYSYDGHGRYSCCFSGANVSVWG